MVMGSRRARKPVNLKVPGKIMKTIPEYETG
jgi:hypothetical protein